MSSGFQRTNGIETAHHLTSINVHKKSIEHAYSKLIYFFGDLQQYEWPPLQEVTVHESEGQRYGVRKQENRHIPYPANANGGRGARGHEWR